MLPDAPVKRTVPLPSGTKRRAASRPTRKPPKQPTRQKSVSELDAYAGLTGEEVQFYSGSGRSTSIIQRGHARTQ
jgi:hypothetical protein